MTAGCNLSYTELQSSTWCNNAQSWSETTPSESTQNNRERDARIVLKRLAAHLEAVMNLRSWPATTLVILLGTLASLRVMAQRDPNPDILPDSALQQCSELAEMDKTRLPNPSTEIIAAKVVSNDPAGNATTKHCEILGKMNERIGFNSQSYGIRFHLRLPLDWNGGFYFRGGGGTNGNLGDALGFLPNRRPRVTALSLGYAVVSQDGGHDNTINNDPSLNGTQTFGFDPQARLDYGYNSYDQVTQTAKVLITAFYGEPPRRSYYVGCSEGGREGMMMSQRFPSYYDGIVSLAPGFTLPKASVFGEAWDTQAFAEVATAGGVYDRFGQPFLNKTSSDDDLVLASNAVLSACDALDGLVEDYPSCTTARVDSKLDALECRQGKDASCLSQPQLNALRKVFDGARNSRGELLYSDWSWDAGIGGKVGDAYFQGWRRWKIGQFDSATNSAINVTLGAGAASAVFTTPPTPMTWYGPGRMQFLLGFNFDIDAEKIHAASRIYGESAWDFMMASSTELSEFRDRGSKLVIIHGVSDPIFSINDTINWWQDVNRANNGAASDFVRLFAVPGMAHCSGGPATDQFDAFSAVVEWVERDLAPDSILATAGDNTPWPNRTRPLCPFPKQVRYTGEGSIEDASNFVCTAVADR